MKFRVTSAAAVAAAALGILGCAGTPPAPSAPANRLADQGAAATVAAGPGSPAAAVEPDDNPFPGTIKRTTSNGVVLYCRPDKTAASRIPKLVCATEETMRNQVADSRRVIDEIREGAGTTGGCVPGASSGC